MSDAAPFFAGMGFALLGLAVAVTAPVGIAFSSVGNYFLNQRRRRNFARRALRMPIETGDSEKTLSEGKEAKEDAAEARDSARERGSAYGIITTCKFNTHSIESALETIAYFPQPDGSFVHIKTSSKEFAGFWLDGEIESVYHNVLRPADALPFVIPELVVARFSDPRGCFKDLITLRIARIADPQ